MIIVNAKLDVKESNTDKVISLADDLIKESRNHQGNISYNLYRDVVDNSLIFVEKWESKEDLQKHMKEEVFINFGKNTKDLLESEMDVQLYVVDQIDWLKKRIMYMSKSYTFKYSFCGLFFSWRLLNTFSNSFIVLFFEPNYSL